MTIGDSRPSRSHPARSQFGQHLIPRSSRTTSPEAPGQARQSPQRHGWKALLTPGIPAYHRSGRKRQDRPVTPEVVGSSPVAPVKYLQSGIFCCRSWRKRPPVSFHPAYIPHANGLESPQEAGQRRKFPQCVVRAEMTGGLRAPGCERCAFAGTPVVAGSSFDCHPLGSRGSDPCLRRPPRQKRHSWYANART